jgi:Spy/CpxP family protein refolding chaperone
MKTAPMCAALACILLSGSPAAANSKAPPPPHIVHAPAPRPAAPQHVSTPSSELRGRGFVPSVHNLNLSADQNDRIRGIIESTRQANAAADPQTRRDNIQKMRQAIWQTLTPEQREQFKAERLRQSETQPTP